ncbi:hypothetical protein ABKN59_006313 [Abortiporus biennis]
MSLSALLLGSSGSSKGAEKSVDKGLDDIFRTSTIVAPAPPPKSVKTTPVSEKETEKKRKLTEETVEATSSKRAKSEKLDKTKNNKSSPVKSSKKSKKSKKDVEEDVDEDVTSSPTKEHAQEVPVHISEDADADSDDEGDPSTLVHESLKTGKSKSKGKSKASAKYVPEDETPEQRNSRTIFVGNVSLEVAKSRPLEKQFKRHVISFVPSAKIESVRFRSVAFQKPTAELPSSSTAEEKDKSKETRQHNKDRAASWRRKQSGDNDEEETGTIPQKVFTPADKKRVAFIKQEFHTGVDSLNAYVVFAHPIPQEKLSTNRSSNVPPPKPVMDPYEAAKIAAEKVDGTTFLERTIRADVVRKTGDGDVKDGMGGDPKLTIFVGNLDFASKEEDLRVFFEGVVSAERGPPPIPEDGGNEDEDEEIASWVKRVRIIRDKDTLLGKGFAYVQFIDRECVDEILALSPDHLKFAKRKLRVQRCKTLPSSTKKPVRPAPSNTTPAHINPQRQHRFVAPVPKGDPALGDKISHLSKEDRKKVKSTDADRVARRLAKKKNAKVKMNIAEKGGKDRERVRRKTKETKNKGSKNSGKRIRSDAALTKMNRKK